MPPILKCYFVNGKSEANALVTAGGSQRHPHSVHEFELKVSANKT